MGEKRRGPRENAPGIVRPITKVALSLREEDEGEENSAEERTNLIVIRASPTSLDSAFYVEGRPFPG